MHSINGKCISQGPQTICEGFTVTDLGGIAFYINRNCTEIHGDIFISSLPLNVSDAMLFSAFSQVTAIHGALTVVDNAYLTSLRFFSQLSTVWSVYLENNAALVDATLENVNLDPKAVFVSGCSRLCPSRYPGFRGDLSNSTLCANRTMQYCLEALGPASTEDFSLLRNILARMSQSVFGANVCIFRTVLFLQVSYDCSGLGRRY